LDLRFPPTPSVVPTSAIPDGLYTGAVVSVDHGIFQVDISGNQLICVLAMNFFDLRLHTRSELGQVVGAEDTDGVDHDGERDHQLEGGRQELTRLERDPPDHDDGIREALGPERGEEGRDDAVHESGKKARDHRPEIERR